MNRVFHFTTPETFQSGEASDFAQYLLQSNSTVTRSIIQGLGLQVNSTTHPPSLTHDGRKIGLATFASGSDNIICSIGPKTAFAASELIQEIRDIVGLGKTVQFGELGDVSIGSGANDLSLAFLLGLHETIANYASRHVDITHHRQDQLVGWNVRGQPRVDKTMRRIAMGRLDGIVSRVYDDRAFEPYADVLLGTADSIRAEIAEWGELVAPISGAIGTQAAVIHAHLRPLSSGRFSRIMVHRICRPPFPLGLQTVLQSCLMFWRHRGSIAMQNNGTASPARTLSLDLAQLFELYVGAIWSQALSRHLRWRASPQTHYSFTATRTPIESGTLIPDYAFWDQHGSCLMLVDAKYRLDIGSRDSIYQMVAYLDSAWPGFPAREQRIGVLVYPGTDWQVWRVEGFSHLLYCVQMPVGHQDVEANVRGFAFNAMSRDRRSNEATVALEDGTVEH
jgi:hypothetical protein